MHLLCAVTTDLTAYTVHHWEQKQGSIMMYVDAAGSNYDYQDLFIRMVFPRKSFSCGMCLSCCYHNRTCSGVTQVANYCSCQAHHFLPFGNVTEERNVVVFSCSVSLCLCFLCPFLFLPSLFCDRWQFSGL